MSQPVIRVENLSKTYRLGQIGTGTISRDLEAWWAKLRGKPNPLLQIGEKDHGNRDGETLWALKNVSFEVQQGEALGIIGRNGAGKSTLLKILSRVTAPTSGRIKVKGRIASLLEVGTGFHPELTGRENIYLNGAILGMTRDEVRRKFDEIVDFSDVEKFIDTPVKRYSSGMYVRLAFAVAAHLDPEILIVDEVLAVGDVEFQKKCLGKMGDVAQQGRTVLFVSHNLGAIKTLCRRAILMQHGSLLYDAAPMKTIGYYYGGGDEEKAIYTWDPEHLPRLASSELIEAGILSEYNFIGPDIPSQRPCQIYIKFRVFQESAKVGTTVLLHTAEGQTLLVSISNHEPEWHMKARPVGCYKSVCEIPENLLTDGKYSISIGLWEGFYEKGLVESHILRFTIHEEGLVRGDLPYEMKSTDLIRPLLKWSSAIDG